MATMTLPETEVKETKQSTTKYVYSFGGGKADGNGKMKDVLGGKGAGLAEMTNAGLPVRLISPGIGSNFFSIPKIVRNYCPASAKRRWPRPTMSLP